MHLAVRKLSSKTSAKRILRSIVTLCLLGCLLSAGVIASAWFDRDPVLFQSWESKTALGGPVFNRIAFYPGSETDIWMMQQSHFGAEAASVQWERIAIVVSHDKERTATYYQLPSGSLETDDVTVKPVVETGKRANCYMCHANGPRAIRPAPEDGSVAISFWNRVRLLVWNTRIKTYGRFAPTAQDKEDDYRIQSDLANTVLSSPACVSCHPDGPGGGNKFLPDRGSLRRQHFMSIDFMVRQGLMPPPGFALSSKEKERILAFIGSE